MYYARHLGNIIDQERSDPCSHRTYNQIMNTDKKQLISDILQQIL